MIRAVLYLVISILLITFLRVVIGMIMKAMREMTAESSSPASAPQPAPPRTVTGELKRDPVCGTFVPASSSFQKSLKGKSYCFCSAECRDKYAG